MVFKSSKNMELIWVTASTTSPNVNVIHTTQAPIHLSTLTPRLPWVFVSTVVHPQYPLDALYQLYNSSREKNQKFWPQKIVGDTAR